MTLTDQMFQIADQNGCVSYAVCEAISRQHYILGDFFKEYGMQDDWSIGVDVGEFLVWMGY